MQDLQAKQFAKHLPNTAATIPCLRTAIVYEQPFGCARCLPAWGGSDARYCREECNIRASLAFVRS